MNTNHSSSGDQRTTFVLVHGSGTSSHMWAPLQRELALQGRKSYAIDLPGHGFDAQYSFAYQSPQNLDALRTEASTLASITLEDECRNPRDSGSQASKPRARDLGCRKPRGRDDYRVRKPASETYRWSRLYFGLGMRITGQPDRIHGRA